MLTEALASTMASIPSAPLLEKKLAFGKFVAEHGKSYASKTNFDDGFDAFSVNYDQI